MVRISPPIVQPAVKFDFDQIRSDALEGRIFTDDQFAKVQAGLKRTATEFGKVDARSILAGLAGGVQVRVITIRNTTLAINLVRELNGRLNSHLLTTMQRAYKQRAIPRVQVRHSQMFAQQVAAGEGRAGYRRTGAYSRQRPERLLEKGLKDGAIWTLRPGAQGFYLDLKKLDRFPGRSRQGRSSASLRDYWRVQSAGTSHFVGRRISISSPSAAGFRSIRDLSSKSGNFQRRNWSTPFRVRKVKNRIQGYNLPESAGRALREVVIENPDFLKELHRDLQAVGIPASVTLPSGQTVGGVTSARFRGRVPTPASPVIDQFRRAQQLLG